MPVPPITRTRDPSGTKSGSSDTAACGDVMTSSDRRLDAQLDEVLGDGRRRAGGVVGDVAAGQPGGPGGRRWTPRRAARVRDRRRRRRPGRTAARRSAPAGARSRGHRSLERQARLGARLEGGAHLRQGTGVVGPVRDASRRPSPGGRGRAGTAAAATATCPGRSGRSPRPGCARRAR